DIIKKHPVMGNQILLSISEYPYLSIGARYHHERYDGRGYPDRLKGGDIPEIARIISVADAYDAMSSNRSYREVLPQQLVREEIVKGAGTQFDPQFAKIMQKIIDLDEKYELREKAAVSELAGKNELVCQEFRSAISDGICVDRNLKRIHLKVDRNKDAGDESRGAAIILFDSLDERVHEDPATAAELNYFEYCEVWFDGNTVKKGAREVKTVLALNRPENSRVQRPDQAIVYDIEAVKCKDHVQIKIDDGLSTATVTIALPDSSRYVYIGLTGEQCLISDVSITQDDDPIPFSYIPRIAEEISYISGPQGDIPSIQVDTHRSEATEGVPINDRLTLSFHTMSLPTARLIWHCTYLIIFSSEDGKVHGKDYREYSLVRMDGEILDSDPQAKNILSVHRQDDFAGWDDWKEKNKAGFDCTVTFEKNDNVVTMTTENLGIAVKNITTIPEHTGNLYAALTGDQCVITNIKTGQ
ncbi:MAG: diguanylate cyclase, partial [Lachnospiraceae bacterium]|nr:diguanylate cyclase [Lachnospiraceae bacterium]